MLHGFKQQQLAVLAEPKMHPPAFETTSWIRSDASTAGWCRAGCSLPVVLSPLPVVLSLLPIASCPLHLCCLSPFALFLLPSATWFRTAVMLQQLLHNPAKTPTRVYAFPADKFQLLHLSVTVAFAEQLQLDTEALAEGRLKDVSLAAKWAPTPQGDLTMTFVGFIS